MTMNEYLTSWELFINYIASQFEGGRDEIDISKEFCGRIVEWEGCITAIELDEEYCSGVAISMAPGIIPLSKGKVLRAKHLFLNMENTSSWGGCRVGDNIRFKATISKSVGPFPEIRISVESGDPEVLFMMKVYESQLISIL